MLHVCRYMRFLKLIGSKCSESLATTYISEVKRFKVCAARPNGYEYVYWVLKSYPRKNIRGRSFRSDDFFKNEIMFYESTLPKLLEFQNSKELSDPFDNHVQLVFTYAEAERYKYFVVMADATTKGFESIKQTDMEHGKLLLRTLGKVHAISFAFKAQNPEEFEKVSKVPETYYSDRFCSWYRQLWTKICAVAIDAVEKEYPDTKYDKKIKEFAVANTYKDMIKAVTDTRRRNGVILHGNCRSSNYLCKYQNEKPVEMKIVDFQQVRCASPVLDVSSIFYTNPELLKEYDGLLRYYHAVLSTQIIELGSNPDVYTWEVFSEEVRRYSFFGLAFSFEVAATAVTKQFDWDAKKSFNIAEVLQVNHLEGQGRLALAKAVQHSTDYGYM